MVIAISINPDFLIHQGWLGEASAHYFNSLKTNKTVLNGLHLFFDRR
jgi:hypothetical protein